MSRVARVRIALSLICCVAIASCDCLCRTPSQPDPPTPANLGRLKLDLEDYHSRDYELQIAAKLQEAGDWIRKRAPEVDKPAIVLDIDETSLSNWEELVADDFAFIASGPCELPVHMPCSSPGFDQLARATAIKPTLKVFQDARQLKVAVFFVTGRFEEPLERSSTESNLRKEGYADWTEIFMRRDHDGTVAAYKTGARKQIKDEGYTIIANIGDQYSDLDGGYAERTFKVPNPFYFIP